MMAGGYRTALVAASIIALGGCVSGSAAPPPPQQPSRTAPPSALPAPAVRTPEVILPRAGFIAPQVMRMPGLENVIGRDAGQLQQQLGRARLDIAEGDARKLQFSGEPCVLDIWLYPLRPGAVPVATHIEARRASDGRDVDRAQCVAALERVRR